MSKGLWSSSTIEIANILAFIPSVVYKVQSATSDVGSLKTEPPAWAGALMGVPHVACRFKEMPISHVAVACL